MLERETIEIHDLNANLEDDKVIVRVKVRNPTDRTLYTYGNVRNIQYDNATGKLVLALHDHRHEDDNDPNRFHLPQPKIIQIEGKTTAEIKLKIAPVIRRIKSHTERGAGGPVTEELHVAEANEIQVEIAHQDTPFYYDPKKSNLRQFKEWGRVVSTASFKVTPPREKEKRNDKKAE
jgi:hypothetical protein